MFVCIQQRTTSETHKSSGQQLRFGILKHTSNISLHPEKHAFIVVTEAKHSEKKVEIIYLTFLHVTPRSRLELNVSHEPNSEFMMDITCSKY